MTVTENYGLALVDDADLIGDAVKTKANANISAIDSLLGVHGTSISSLERRFNVLQYGFDPSTITWSDSSWDDISMMLEAHYAGKLDIHEWWSVGDSRTVELSEMEAETVTYGHTSVPDSTNPVNGATSSRAGSAVCAQSVELVLVDASNPYRLSGGEEKSAFIVQQKNILINANNTFDSTQYYLTVAGDLDWDGSFVRPWMNQVYKNALPVGLQSIMKRVSVASRWLYAEADASYSDGVKTVTHDDYLFFPTEKEVFGEVVFGSAEAESNLAQWDYYSAPDTRIKLNPKRGSAGTWVTRTLFPINYRPYAAYVNTDGSAGQRIANTPLSVVPAFCI